MKSFTVANERRSTTRYTGDVTYIFNPEQVRRVMRTTGVAYADTAARRILIVPMAPGYAKGSAWTTAWPIPAPERLGAAVLPAGDGADMGALGKLNFENATWANVAGVASRTQAAEVALLRSPRMVRIHHLAPTAMPTGSAIAEVPVPGGNLGAAAAASQNALEDYWKMQARSISTSASAPP
jgi:hypothetical protein